jgi:C-terminal peptidase prc
MALMDLMQVKKIFTYFALILLLASGCTKSKDYSNHGQNVAKIPTDQAVMGSAEVSKYICNNLYDFSESAKTYHLEGNEIDINAKINESLKRFREDIMGKAFEINTGDQKLNPITKDDCSAILALASIAEKSEPLMEYYDKVYHINETTKVDVTKFNGVVFVLEHVLQLFMQSLDEFSNYYGIYNQHFSDHPSLEWGIQFLDRPDYYETGKQKARKPAYLYVLFSPKYLNEKLPIKTKILQINAHIVKDGTYTEALKELEKSKKHVLKVQKISSTGEYLPEELVAVEFKYYPNRKVTFELISENPRIGYINIPTFLKGDLDTDFFKSVLNQEKLDGTILDLRHNPGGFDEAASNILSTIFPQDTIFGYKYNRPTSPEDIGFKPTSTIDPAPFEFGRIVVLTDFDTVSASEIITATLKDYGAALIVGEKTFGKGIGQLLGNLAFLGGTYTVTHFYLYSPSGKSWYIDGIDPNILVEEPANKPYYFRMKDVETKPKPAKTFGEVNYDPDVEVQHRVTPGTLKHLQDFRNDPTNAPQECDPKTAIVEEKTCIYEWSKKILHEWIRAETSSAPAAAPTADLPPGVTITP